MLNKADKDDDPTGANRQGLELSWGSSRRSYTQRRYNTPRQGAICHFNFYKYWIEKWYNHITACDARDLLEVKMPRLLGYWEWT